MSLVNLNMISLANTNTEQKQPTSSDKLKTASTMNISQVDLKKFRNLEAFYVKKMKDFGFEDFNYESTNKLLVRSEANLQAKGKFTLGGMNYMSANCKCENVSLGNSKSEIKYKESWSSLIDFQISADSLVTTNAASKINETDHNHSKVKEKFQLTQIIEKLNKNNEKAQNKVNKNLSNNHANFKALELKVLSETDLKIKRNASKQSLSKNRSPSLTTMPEIVEASLPTFVSLNLDRKESKRFSSNINNTPTSTTPSSEQSQNQAFNASNTTSMSRVLRTAQSELTLPPIIEFQVVSNSSHNNNNGNKNGSRIDSGIITDETHHGKANLTLSTNGSEKEYDLINSAKINNRHDNTVVTMIELVEASNGSHPALVRKNTTASTFNSYGQSSPSVQSRRSANYNSNSFINNKRGAALQHQASVNSNSNSNKMTSNNAPPHVVTVNETKYVDICEKLNTLSDVKNNYFINNSDKVNGNVGNHQLSHKHRSEVSNANKRPGVERSNSNNHITNGIEPVSSNDMKLFNASSYAKKAIKDVNRNNMAHTQSPRRLNRQNTVLSSARAELSSVMAGGAASTTMNAPSAQPPKYTTPTPKPRKSDGKATTLQQLGALMTSSSNNNSTKLVTNVINAMRVPLSGNTANSNDSSLIRPNTRRKSASVQNRENLASSYNINIINNTVNNARKSSAATGEKINRQINAEVNTSNVNLDPQPKQEQVSHMTIMSTLALINANTSKTADGEANAEVNENGLSEFTLQRILKWLEGIEKCSNMIKPPSYLAWSENDNSISVNYKKMTKHSNGQQGHYGSNRAHHGGFVGANEYALSDYDSFDEQIVAYNRVVDKTFHIVHDEDED